MRRPSSGYAEMSIRPSPRDGEMRYLGIGYIGPSLHTVIYVRRGVRTRIISLRKPSNEERNRYAQA